VDQINAPGNPGLIVLGEVTGHFGVKGWVKVKSYTRPQDSILAYKNWYLLGQEGGLRKPSGPLMQAPSVFKVAEARKQGRSLIARLEGVSSRESAEPLIGQVINVPVEDLEPAGDGEYYWTQLMGLEVSNLAGELLGEVDHLLETGANDVLVVIGKDGKGEPVECLVPWIEQVIVEVNLDQRRLLIDWDADF